MSSGSGDGPPRRPVSGDLHRLDPRVDVFRPHVRHAWSAIPSGRIRWPARDRRARRTVSRPAPGAGPVGAGMAGRGRRRYRSATRRAWEEGDAVPDAVGTARSGLHRIYLGPLIPRRKGVPCIRPVFPASVAAERRPGRLAGDPSGRIVPSAASLVHEGARQRSGTGARRGERAVFPGRRYACSSRRSGPSTTGRRRRGVVCPAAETRRFSAGDREDVDEEAADAVVGRIPWPPSRYGGG